jgi:hypothetical protein
MVRIRGGYRGTSGKPSLQWSGQRYIVPCQKPDQKGQKSHQRGKKSAGQTRHSQVRRMNAQLILLNDKRASRSCQSRFDQVCLVLSLYPKWSTTPEFAACYMPVQHPAGTVYENTIESHYITCGLRSCYSGSSRSLLLTVHLTQA